MYLAAMKIGHLHSIKNDLVFISVQPLLMNASMCCSSWLVYKGAVESGMHMDSEHLHVLSVPDIYT